MACAVGEKRDSDVKSFQLLDARVTAIMHHAKARDEDQRHNAGKRHQASHEL